MRLIIGKILLLAVVIGLGSGIAYVAFKRMPKDGRAITSDQLAKAVQLSESTSGTLAPTDNAESAAPQHSEPTSPFALTEPADEDAPPAIGEQLAEIPPAESPKGFQFELPETATAVTPVSFTTESTDDSQDTGDSQHTGDSRDTEKPTDDDSSAANSQSRQAGQPDSSSDEAAVMFFGSGSTDETALSTPKDSSRSDGRSTGGFTLLPSVAPAPADRPASAIASKSSPTPPRRTTPAPVSASRAARESAKASASNFATDRPSASTQAPVTKTSPATTTPAPTTVAAAAKPPVVAEPIRTAPPVPGPAPIPRTRPQTPPRTPAGPAGNIFFAGNSPASAGTANAHPAQTASSAQPAVTPLKPVAAAATTAATTAAVPQTSSTIPQPVKTVSSRPTAAPSATTSKDPLLTQTAKPSRSPAFPGVASLDEPLTEVPAPEPSDEPDFPSLSEPAMEGEENSAASAASSADDLPFMRSLDPPAPVASAPPEKSAATETFNPFAPVEPTPANPPPKSADTFEPQFEPSTDPTLNPPVSDTPPTPRTTPDAGLRNQPKTTPARPATSPPPVTTPPADSARPDVLFPELTVPEPVPSFPSDQPTTASPVNPQVPNTPASRPTPAPTPANSSPPPNPGPFANDAGRPRVTPPSTSVTTPATQPRPATPSPAPANSSATQPPKTSSTSNPFAPEISAELPFEPTAPAEPATPVMDEPPVRTTQPDPADLPPVPLPAEPGPFPTDPIRPPVTSGRSVESLQTLPERSEASGNAGSRTMIQPDRSRSESEPFPIERGGTPQRIRSNLRPSPSTPSDSTPANPEPFPITEEPERPDLPVDAQPLPPFEELPSRAGRGELPSVPDRSNRPDSRRVEGGPPIKAVEKLRPQLTIEKKAPESATIGIAHEYRILVSNDGDTAARDVVVEDELNGAAEFVSSSPPADYDARTGVILWNFEELEPRESREIVVRVKPTGEGMLTGTATVRFRTEVRSATLIRAPKLQLEIDGPQQVLVGEDVKLRFTIRNAGSGDAAGVLLRSVLPDAIRHPEGADLEYEIELLRAGDEQSVDLTAVAAEPGRPVRISAEISASGIAPVVARNNLTVVGSQLTVERLGPARRFVGRPAKFQNVVVNQSDFDALDAVITEDVPQGMRVIAVGSGGEYNAKNRRITWQLPQLKAGAQTVLEVELQPEITGRMESIVEVSEKAGFRSRAEENTVVEVEGLHNVTADISRQDQPVAVGERFGFTVAVDNRGTAVARNVELIIQVPAGLQVLAAGTREIPGRLLPGNIVRYSVVRSLKPDEQLPFQVTLQGREAVRNAVIQAQLKYDEMTQPLIISESVTVFDDQP
ncbi:MAG: hypothetical protein ACKO2P_02815 [Planctomycetota bacterium]